MLDFFTIYYIVFNPAGSDVYINNHYSNNK